MSDTAQDQARAQYESVSAMVAAIDCDYSRLEELREELQDLTDTANEANSVHEEALKIGPDGSAETWAELCEANIALSDWREANSEELAQLESNAGDCEDEDEARQRIQEDALSVEVRSDWTAPGETLEPSEFCILLCTGGPAVRILGELDNGSPSRAWLEYQDWGTPWTQLFDVDASTLIRYASEFFFGE